tara:strand:- start:410 stop:685 length:276 start_codon:yes stop_codon:yes gene_type:complete
MSVVQRDALRDRVDATVGAYVEAASVVLEENTSALITALEERIENLEVQSLVLQQQVNELLEAEAKPADADKYALTKSKLIKLMKDMGYYD